MSVCAALCVAVSLGERQALASDEVAIEMCIYSEYELQGILSTLSSTPLVARDRVQSVTRAQAFKRNTSTTRPCSGSS